MYFSTLAVAALASLASAQTTGKMIAVTVGINGTLKFSPDNVQASVGDMVQFQFVAGNHTATQSTFDNPCQPISMHSANATGFHSGFQPAAASAALGMTSTYTVAINDTKPIWVYCAQGKHCESGMVMVINENTAANATRSLTEFKKLAAGASTLVPAANSTTGGTAGTTTGVTAGTTTGTAGATATAGGMSLGAPSTVGLLAVAAALLMV